MMTQEGWGLSSHSVQPAARPELSPSLSRLCCRHQPTSSAGGVPPQPRSPEWFCCYSTLQLWNSRNDVHRYLISKSLALQDRGYEEDQEMESQPSEPTDGCWSLALLHKPGNSLCTPQDRNTCQAKSQGHPSRGQGAADHESLQTQTELVSSRPCL